MANNHKYDKYTREELVDELETLKKKKYGLVWDKKNSQEVLDAFVNWENVPENFVPKQFPVLKEVKNKEIDTDKDKPVNLLIEGDNYHSLAVLNFTHQNEIDVIYIDPPYNTGNKDFIYNDKFVDRDDPFRHSKWLSFMEKRLKLAKNLLSKDGVMFVSIDDNEQAQLKMLCDEIFGEKNTELMVWKKVGEGDAGAGRMKITYRFRVEHEYIIVCYSQKDRARFSKTLELPKFKNEYTNPDNDPRGPYKAGNMSRNEDNSSPEGKNYYTVVSPSGKKFSRQWHFDKQIFDKLNKDKRIYWGKNGDSVPAIKIFINELRPTTPVSIIEGKGSATSANKALKEMFGDRVFDNPKPLELIQYLLQISTKPNSLVLDFFAGTGTTGQAVLELNKNDKGSRKFILGTNNENGICTEVCHPRIEKVVNGYKNASDENISGLGGNLKYFKTDFVGSDSTDKNKRDLVNKSAEMICIKEDIFDLVADKGFDYKIYQKGKKFLGVIFDNDAIAEFKKEAEKYKGNFVVYCFSYTEATPEKEFKGLKNKYVLKPIPAIILKIYIEIFKK
ncbi:hypothetical protein A3F49_03500 [Candidatus Nomurabacteria bacterium RIFCSPHIGHO2_12_FULL_42_19]|nr:MAG: hypothetical protein A3F49_03500 [Candidatus Nomurabacteria bacterium RIFCSPHIGHO2_12_FULL_42_19]